MDDSTMGAAYVSLLTPITVKRENPPKGETSRDPNIRALAALNEKRGNESCIQSSARRQSLA